MNDEVKNMLQTGETIKWVGTPRDIKLTDPANRNRIMISYCISIVWILASLIFYLPRAMGMDNSVIQLIIVVVVLDCIPIMLLISPVREVLALKKTVYYITDRRVFVKGTDKVMTIALGKDLPVKNDKISEKLNNILLGSAVQKKPSQHRTVAVFGDMEEHETAGLVLYHIQDGEKAWKLITGETK